MPAANVEANLSPHVLPPRPTIPWTSPSFLILFPPSQDLFSVDNCLSFLESTIEQRRRRHGYFLEKPF
jgi:hypothetical protein